MAGRYGRDYQQGRVYKWQWGYNLQQNEAVVLDVPTQRALIAQVWREQHKHGKPCPTAKVSRGRAWYRAGEHLICIQRRCKRTTVLHEMAHALVRGNPRTANSLSHGREWVATYIRLCAVYIDFSEEDMRLDARRHGVSVASAPVMEVA